jgi:uncharacterized protein (TIGR02271 family)
MKTKLYNRVMTCLLTVGSGLLIAGCSSSNYEETGYINEPSGAAAPTASDQSAMVIPLHEEKVNVGKRDVDSGQVTIRKTVTTKTVSQPVELRTEQLSIEREPAGAQNSAADASGAAFGQPFEEKSVTIPLRSEQPVVEKTTVKTGDVIARKQVQINKQNVQEQVRSEDIQVDRGNTP